MISIFSTTNFLPEILPRRTIPLETNQLDQGPEEQTVHITDRELRSINFPETQVNQPKTNLLCTSHRKNNKEAPNDEIGPHTNSMSKNNPLSLPQHIRAKQTTLAISTREPPLSNIQLHQLPSLPSLMLQILRQTTKLKWQKLQTY